MRAFDGVQNEKLGVQNALVVLGMHRSGTSALTGLLEICGARTPLNQFPATKQNAKGFFEAKSVAGLNDKLLAAYKLGWDSWGAMPFDLLASNEHPELSAEALALIKDEFGGADLIALKDPRICRVWPFWASCLDTSGYAAFIVFAFRHPVEVALSLKERNDLSIPYGLLLWTAYVLDAEFSSRGLRRSFSHFASLMDAPVQTLTRINMELGGVFSFEPADRRSEILQFLDTDLRHHVLHNLNEVPELTQAVYRTLLEWSKSGEDKRSYSKLDAIRKRFSTLSNNLDETDVLFESLRLMNQNNESDMSFDDLGAEGLKVRCRALTEVKKLSDAESSAQLSRIALLEKENSLSKSKISKQKKEIEIQTLDAERRDRELAQLTESLLVSKAQYEKTQLEVDRLKITVEQIGKLEKENSVLTDRCAKAEIDNNALSATVTDLSATQANLDSEINQLRSSVSKLQAEVQCSSQELTKAHAIAENANAQLHAISTSTTWRATGPLRALVNTIRRTR